MQADAQSRPFDSPYPGLRAFRRQEAGIFFGRDEQIDALVKRLRASRFVAVVGESGCGKSSLVRAGLLPMLDAGFLDGAGARWCFADMRPGNQPIQNLALALASALSTDDHKIDSDILAARLRRGPRSILDLLDDRPLPPNTELLVVVDQFEELLRFRARIDSNEADAFWALVHTSVTQQPAPVRFVLTLRTDYLGECARFRGLPEMLNTSQYLVPRLEREELVDAIVSPARVFDGDVDPSLANHIVNVVGRNQDQLPVIEHALQWMWTRARGNDQSATSATLTMSNFEALGGVGEALSKHAEQVFNGLQPGQQAIAQGLFCALWDDHAKGRDTRRACTVAEAAAIVGVTTDRVIAVADVFRRVEHSMLMPPIDAVKTLDPTSMLDISHESLFRHWKRLVDWIANEAKNVEQYRRWSSAALSWRAGDGDLLADRTLDAAEAWWDSAGGTESWARRYSRDPGDFAVLREFLHESRQARSRKLAAAAADDAAKRRWRRVQLATVIVIAAIVAGFIAYLVYKDLYVWEHVEYYREWDEIRGEPRAFGRLSKGDTKHRPVSVRVTRAGRWGHITRAEYIDGNGQLVDHDKAYLDASEASQVAARTDYTYDGDGRLATAFQYSKDDAFVQGRIVMPLAADGTGQHRDELSYFFIGMNGMPTAVRANSDHSAFFWTEVVTWTGNTETSSYRGRDGESIPGKDWAYGRQIVLDDEGKTLATHSIDALGKQMLDAFGNNTIEAAYDASGLPIRNVSKDADGRITKLASGYAIVQFKYDEYGNQTDAQVFDENMVPVSCDLGWHEARSTYDESRTTLEGRYFDVQGNPTTDTRGCYVIKDVYSGGRVTRESCASADGSPRATIAGYVTRTMKYDRYGHQTSETYLDASDRPVVAANGYASIENVYDLQGRLTEIRHLGVSGEPVLDTKGWATQTFVYDETRHSRTASFFGAKNEPIKLTDGYARLDDLLDSFGDVIEEHYFDTTGRPALYTDGYYGVREIRDASGLVTETYYLGENGQIIFNKDGYAGYRVEYDDLGHVKRATYLGTRHEKLAKNGGVAEWTASYDQWGHQTSQRYFDVDGRPVSLPGGDAGFEAHYDAMGDLLEIQYVGVDNHPTMHAWDDGADGGGYASKKLTYDAHRQLITEEYFGTDGNSVAKPSGWSKAVYEYDDRGNQTKAAYFAGTSPAVDSTSNAHIVITGYDSRRRPIDVRYFGLDGAPLRAIAHMTIKYEGLGKLETERAFFGPGDTPASDANGLHRMTTTYDSVGNILGKEWFGVDDIGYELQKLEYDSSGRLTREEFIDPHGACCTLTRVPPNPCAAITHEYLANGNKRDTCLGLDGKPSASADGWAYFEESFAKPDQIARVMYYGADGKPFLQQGVAGKEFAYDDEGKQIEETTIDGNGTPVDPPRGFATHRTVYDPRTGNATALTFVSKSGATIRIEHRYDERGRLVEDQYLAPTQLVPGAQYLTEYTYDALGHLSEIQYRTPAGEPMEGMLGAGDTRHCGRSIPTYKAGKIVSWRCERLRK